MGFLIPTGTTSRGPADKKVKGAAQAAADAETEAPNTFSLPRDIGARSIFFTHCIPLDPGREFLQDNRLKLMGAYWGLFTAPSSINRYISVSIPTAQKRCKQRETPGSQRIPGTYCGGWGMRFAICLDLQE